MQYRIISVTNFWTQKRALEQLVREVNEALKQGWEPQGGLAIQAGVYMQAMIKPR